MFTVSTQNYSILYVQKGQCGDLQGWRTVAFRTFALFRTNCGSSHVWQVPFCSFCILCDPGFVCGLILASSLCVLGKRKYVWSVLKLLFLQPPDEDAFQSAHRTQMLRLAWGNHTLRETGAWGEFIFTGFGLNSFPAVMSTAIIGKMLQKSSLSSSSA